MIWPHDVTHVFFISPYRLTLSLLDFSQSTLTCLVRQTKNKKTFTWQESISLISIQMSRCHRFTWFNLTSTSYPNTRQSMSSQTINELSSSSSANRPCTDMQHRLPEETSRVYKSAKVKSETDTNWAVVPNASITFQWRGRGIGYRRKDLFNTYKRRKSSPLCPRSLTTLQDSQRFWEA